MTHIIAICVKKTFSDITFYFCQYKQTSRSEGRYLGYRPPCDTVSRPDIKLKHIKKRLQRSHLCTGSLVGRARGCFFWPEMAAEIKQIAGDCEGLPLTIDHFSGWWEVDRLIERTTTTVVIRVLKANFAQDGESRPL